MQVRIDRDSVCAGDDIEEHEELRRYEPQMKFGYVIQSILNSGFLPIFEGSSVAWVVVVDSKAIGVVCGQWSTPKLIINLDTPVHEACGAQPSTIHFQYHSGANADALFNGLS